LPPGAWLNNVWVAGRDTLIDNLLQQVHGFHLRDFRGPIYLTEWGYSDGYSGFKDMWNCTDIARGMAYSTTQYQNRPWISGLLLWNVGSGGGRWTDLGGCLGEIARQVAQ
jgi:hypothetical protein